MAIFAYVFYCRYFCGSDPTRLSTNLTDFKHLLLNFYLFLSDLPLNLTQKKQKNAIKPNLNVIICKF